MALFWLIIGAVVGFALAWWFLSQRLGTQLAEARNTAETVRNQSQARIATLEKQVASRDIEISDLKAGRTSTFAALPRPGLEEPAFSISAEPPEVGAPASTAPRRDPPRSLPPPQPSAPAARRDPIPPAAPTSRPPISSESRRGPPPPARSEPPAERSYPLTRPEPAPRAPAEAPARPARVEPPARAQQPPAHPAPAMRSELPVRPETSVRPDAPPSQEPRPSPPRRSDDLTRIKGIGKVLNRKLRDIGVTSFRQIAEFTPDDVERVSKVLEFPGRIDREKWVDQARAFLEEDRPNNSA